MEISWSRVREGGIWQRAQEDVPGWEGAAKGPEQNTEAEAGSSVPGTLVSRA